MKKIYLSPELKVTEIVMTQMLATSIRININSTDGAVDAGDAASREFDYDYEDEEE